jgi:hypothetical protein
MNSDSLNIPASKPYDRDRLLELAGSYCDGTASEQEVAWLEQLLAADADARLDFVKYGFVHGQAPFAAAARAQRVSFATAFPEISLAEARQPSRRPRARWAAAALVAVAAIAAVGTGGVIGGFGGLFSPDRPAAAAIRLVAPVAAPALAMVTQSRFLLVRDEANPIWVGRGLNAGRLSILSGAVEMTLRNGVTIILQGPGELDLIDEMKAFLHTGNAVVRVPKGMSGFRLDTATTDVLDLGTEFAVKAESGFITEVQVYDGAVIATGKDLQSGGRFPKRLEAGQAARFGPQSLVGSEPIPYSENRFIRSLPSEAGVEHTQWRERDEELRRFGRPQCAAIAVARVAAPVVVDGDLGEWSHAVGFSGSLDGGPTEAEWVDGRMMYDDECLYIAAHVGDPAPMRNTADPSLDPVMAWQGGGLQVRISTDRAMGWPVDANGPSYYRVRNLEPSDEERSKATNPRLSHLTMWHHAPSRKAAIAINHGMSFDSCSVNPEGVRGAYARDPDGRGYVLEYAIPWRLLNAAEDPPRAGDVLGVVWQVHWSDAAGQIWREQMVEIRNPHELRRILPFERAATWGRAEFQ